ncbi:hypothetical protein [Streptomyces arboris]|uniref:Uncharacterized protein n=1 Tax=Streptomyces arboris TaxID=2600619 RepID=A0A5N5EWD0_9ACTN|nr:hypothetical protein [Streptomyces arboris]KAB2593130.1 hypothetical protein F5983_08650 [Streptomyces arboris]
MPRAAETRDGRPAREPGAGAAVAAARALVFAATSTALALHQLFAAVQNGTAAAPPALHPHGTGPGIHQAWHADHHLAVVMAAGHTVAALLVGWCMQRADASCRTVARHLGHTLDRWLGRPAPAGLFPERRPRTGPPRAWSPPSPYNRTALNHTVVRRGPPATR